MMFVLEDSRLSLGRAFKQKLNSTSINYNIYINYEVPSNSMNAVFSLNISHTN